MLTKTCSRCRVRKPAPEFYPSPNDKSGLHTYCIPCHKQTMKDYAPRAAVKRSARRHAAMAFLCAGPPSCVRCGYADGRALQIDHVDGGGSAESARLGPAGVVARVLRGEGNYQVLCANCNFIKKAENGELAGYLLKR